MSNVLQNFSSSRKWMLTSLVIVHAVHLQMRSMSNHLMISIMKRVGLIPRCRCGTRTVDRNSNLSAFKEMSPFTLFAVSRAITHASSGNKTEMEVLLELDCYLQRTA
jgi:hypothetical protein